MKRLICKILGHEYKYNFGWMPNKCECTRCGMKWKTINNPNYDFRKSNPLTEDMHIWVEVIDPLKETGININNGLFYFSIKKADDCLFSRRNGHQGKIIFGYSVFFKFKSNKHGVR